MTLLELLVAVAVGAMLATLVYASYRGLFQGFAKQSRDAAGVQQMALVKKQLDLVFAEMREITSAYGNTLEYVTGDTAAHNITFQDGVVRKDGAVKASGLTDLTWSISEKTARNGKRLLLWEATLPGSLWLGGAVDVAAAP